ncbi:hypothetical protein F4806DRAFT_259392 [Annulohypoxylon nitens]|nr:hypothetical protein F4806DRAFT_259392 [Annulohypoxylon nitens]
MTKFSALPPELRLRIWDFALHQEAHDRLLIALQEDRFSIPYLVPLKHHASPLLSVNYESRKKAQTFYSIKLAVYETPEIGFEEYVYGFVQSESPKLRPGYFRKIETDPNPKGTLYISPQWDIFVIVSGLDAIYPYILAGQMRGLPSCRYITYDLYDLKDTEISNVACILDQEQRIGSTTYELFYTGPEEYTPLKLTQIPHTIFPADAYNLWVLHTFRRIKNYQYLRLSKAELKTFIFNVMKHGGRGSYNFRDMAVGLSDSVLRLWVLFDRGELQKQNREMSGSELKLKPIPLLRVGEAWNTIKQIENYE